MPIQIVKATEIVPVTSIVTVLLGVPNAGKTSLANTAERPFLLDFDRGGSRRSINVPDRIIVDEWRQIEKLAQADLADYRTLVIDTVGRCLDVLAQDILRREPSLGTSGSLKIQGFGRLKSRFRDWINMLLTWDLNVVIVAHAVEERHGDAVKLRLDAQGSSKEEVYKLADLMGRLSIAEDGSYWLDYDPAASGFGKNCAEIPAGVVPDPRTHRDTLARHIRQTIDHLSRADEARVIEEKRIQGLDAMFSAEAAKGVAAYNVLIGQMAANNAPPADKAICVDVGKRQGWVWDKPSRSFSAPGAPPVDATPPDGAAF